MVRTQIQLTEKQANALKKLAGKERVSLATLVRRGVDAVLASSAAPTAEERRARALASVGKFHSGQRDISIKHDEYLADAFDS